MTYEEIIEETYITPIRSVIAVDDEFPTLDDVLKSIVDQAAEAPLAEAVAPAPQAGMYVPVSPPGMITYPGYNATYPNTGCRGAYWARKPIFNADGLLVGYSRPQYMCPQWY